MLTLLAYLRHVRRPGSVSYATLLLDFWPLGRFDALGTRRAISVLLREKASLFAASALLSVVTFAAQARSNAMPSLERYHLTVRVQKAVLGYGEYLRKVLFPSDLSVFYPNPMHQPPDWQLWAWAGVLAGITGGSLLLRRRAPCLVVGWLWFLGTLLPASGLFQTGLQFIADRYTYVPYIELFIALTFGAAAIVKTCGAARQAVAVGAAIIVGLAFASRAQVGYWRDSASLFAHALAVTRDNWVAHAGLGAELLKRGERDAGRAHFEAALRIHPEDAIAHYNYAVLTDTEGRQETAEHHYRRALELELELDGTSPESAEAHIRLGFLLAATGRLGEAIEHFESAVRAVPSDPANHFNLGAAFDASGDSTSAIRHYQKSLALRPDDAATHNNLGVSLAKSGREEEAVGHFREALRIDPGLEGARENLERLIGKTRPDVPPQGR